MTTKNFLTKTFLSSALLAVAGGAQAAAFQLAEVSSSGLGRAYAGEAAIADNASVVATNPALMTLFKTNQFSAGGVYVDSKIRVDGTVTATQVSLLQGKRPRALAKGNLANNDVVLGAFVPNMYFVAPINDQFAIGAGMNVNFGLKSEYSSDYDGGIFGGKTDLTTINLNLSGAYRVTQGLSFGAGLNAVYAKAKLERNAGVLDDALEKYSQSLTAEHSSFAAVVTARSNAVTKTTSVVRLQDKNAWGFGWNAGLVYEFNEAHRLGFAYHSKVDIDFKDGTAVGNSQTGSGGLTLHLPSYWEFSGFHQLTDDFALHYSYKRTKWSRLQNLHATFDNGSKAFDKDLNYRDASRFALGGTYNVNEQLVLRAGIAYDKAAGKATAAIPDTNRTWYSLGATYAFTPNLSVDFGFAHLRGKKVHFTEKEMVGTIKIEAHYTSKSSANLYGLNLNYSF
ncbi:outer membrane protein transport protein [Avibacterium paragallinarum]|uniref:Outer membrane protein transport protein n=3 Tax=Avibacterium paragallinarum TaxID=728 RepID=A0ABU7QEV5_AVIPA|nr:outer membrane protein transport protein [Avibacterium paragallinarum]QZP16092.1 outer membrane protein transport protein [Avibacterium paragallinarum]WAL57096.1 outer membrane protein transport protein [Avibacterium paragallinarum]WAM59662.1 outer membrane protein transport protein [Avibacterium paragallinarum]